MVLNLIDSTKIKNSQYKLYIAITISKTPVKITCLNKHSNYCIAYAGSESDSELWDISLRVTW